MPNWVYNYITVSGPLKHLQQFIEENSVGDLGNISFERSIPTPIELTQYSAPCQRDGNETEAEFLIRQQRFIQTYGVDDWYEWRVRNWGVKWDLRVEMSSIEEMPEKEGDSFFFHAETPWNTADEAFIQLSVKYPQLDFQVEYEEEMMHFMGKSVFKNGDCEIRFYNVMFQNELGELVNSATPLLPDVEGSYLMKKVGEVLVLVSEEPISIIEAYEDFTEPEIYIGSVNEGQEELEKSISGFKLKVIKSNIDEWRDTYQKIKRKE